MSATCPAHHIFLDFIILIIFDDAINLLIHSFVDAVSGSDYTASSDRMINELERMWKEAVVA
jgi:hypothetical protein